MEPATRADPEAVRTALQAVVDPELGVNIVDLGLVYGVEVDSAGRAVLTMTLTSPACPLTDVIESGAYDALSGLVSDVVIEWVWRPPWSPARASAEGRAQLAALGLVVPE